MRLLSKSEANVNRRWTPLAGQARELVTNLDSLFRRLLFPRIRQESDLELGRQDFRALETIGGKGLLTMTDFSAALDVPVSTGTHAVSRLVKKGLVARARSEEDRRVVEVELSESGRALLQTHLEHRRAMARDMLEPLTPGEREIFLELIEKMARLAVSSGQQQNGVTREHPKAP